MKTVKEKLDGHIRSMQEGGCIPNYKEDDFNAGVLYGFEQGFVACAEFAWRWISVDEELPVDDSQILVKSGTGRCDVRRPRFKFGKCMLGSDITHWRYIDLK
jgi:hypothetical protein